METAGIAGVAVEFNTLLLSLRALSDGPGAPIPFDLGKVMDENAAVSFITPLGEATSEQIKNSI